MGNVDKGFMKYLMETMTDTVKTVSETLKASKDDFVSLGADPKRIDAIRNLLNLSVSDLGEIREVIK